MQIGKSLNILLFFVGVMVCASYAAEFVTVDSIAGTAEVKRAGKNKWILSRRGMKLHNNDVIRAHKKGHVRLRFPDKSLIFVKSNSQILINLINGKESNHTSRHLTVFWGSIFFIVKHAVPRGVMGGRDEKVFSPTAVVSVRGTAFSVNVDRESGTTSTEVVKGTVLVRNILKNVSTFIGAPYKTTVKINTDPILPQPLLDKDIQALYSWVPQKTVDEQIALQLADARRNKQVISGNFEDRVVIVPLDNLSSYDGPWEIREKISAKVVSGLKEMNPNLEVTLYEDSLRDVLAVGAAAKARFVIAGAITTFEIVQHAQVSARADAYSEYNIARIGIDVQVIDVASQKVVFEKLFESEMAAKHGSENSWKEIQKTKFAFDDEKFSDTIICQALKKSLEEMLDEFTRYLHQ